MFLAVFFGASFLLPIAMPIVFAASSGVNEFAFVYDPNNVGAKDKSGLINALDSHDQMSGMGTYVMAAGGLFNGKQFRWSDYLECQFSVNDCLQDDNDSHQEHKYINSYYCSQDSKGNWKTSLSDLGTGKGGKYKYEASVIVALSTNVNKDQTYTYYPNITRVYYTPPPPGTNQAQTQFNWALTAKNGSAIKLFYGGDVKQAHEAYAKGLPSQCLEKPFRQIGSSNAASPIKVPARPWLINKQNKPKGASGVWDKEFKNTAATTGGNNDQGSVAAPGLECNYGFNPLTWVVCPVIDGMVSLSTAIDNILVSQMTVGSQGTTDNPSQIFCDNTSQGKSQDTCKAYKTAWYSFRNIALGLLAIVGLIIIISQMADLEIFNAYTVKKILPRLIFAAIAITLSWQLMQFFVTFTNDLGLGIRNLIYAPFRDIINSGKINGAGSTASLLIGGVGITALGVFGVLSFALTAALAVLVAFLTLVLRQVLIITLVIIAPVAIVASVLPNTQRAYKLWWENFSKALLMFPLIAAMIAAGHVFAAVTLAGGGGPITTFIAFAAYFGPYFMLPATFKFAGGALGAMSGAVNRAAAPGFQGLGNFRANRRKERLQDMKEGRLLKGNTTGQGIAARTRRGVNRGLRGATLTPEAIKKNGFTLDPSKHVSNLRSVAGNSDPARWQKSMAEDTEVSSNMFNRAVMGAAAHGDQSTNGLRQYLANSHGLHGQDLETSISKAQAINRKLGQRGAHYAKAKANSQMADGDDAAVIYADLAQATAGNQSMANAMINDIQTTAKANGRNDVVSSHGAALEEVNRLSALAIANPNSVAVDPKNGGTIMAGSELAQTQATLMESAIVANPGEVFRNIKPNRVAAVVAPLAQQHIRNSRDVAAAAAAYNAALASGNRAAQITAGLNLAAADERLMESSVQVSAIYDSTAGGGMPNEAREELQQHLLGIQVPVIDRTPTGEPALDPTSGNIIMLNSETGTPTIDIAHQVTTVAPNRTFQQRKQAPVVR